MGRRQAAAPAGDPSLLSRALRALHRAVRGQRRRVLRPVQPRQARGPAIRPHRSQRRPDRLLRRRAGPRGRRGPAPVPPGCRPRRESPRPLLRRARQAVQPGPPQDIRRPRTRQPPLRRAPRRHAHLPQSDGVQRPVPAELPGRLQCADRTLREPADLRRGEHRGRGGGARRERRARAGPLRVRPRPGGTRRLRVHRSTLRPADPYRAVHVVHGRRLLPGGSGYACSGW